MVLRTGTRAIFMCGLDGHATGSQQAEQPRNFLASLQCVCDDVTTVFSMWYDGMIL